MASEPKAPKTQAQSETSLLAAIPPNRFYQPLQKSTENETRESRIAPEYYQTSSLFPRATRVMVALNLTEGKLVLEDYRRAKMDSKKEEGKNYRVLHQLVMFGMTNEQETFTQTWSSSNKTPLPWILTPMGSRHYQIALNNIGRSLANCQTSSQFIGAIADAMEAHDNAFFVCKILHRDISVGNIITTDENKGLLIDWDLWIKSDDDKNKETSIARKPRMGAWQFMSSTLLDQSFMGHTYHDDRESAFYVLLWVALRYTRTEATPNSTFTPAKILRTFDDKFVDTAGRVLGGAAKSGLLAHFSHQGLLFSDCPKLDELMKELARVLHARYDPPAADELRELEEELADSTPQRTLAKLVAYKYKDRMMKLEMRGWLVNTIRHYLALGKWPGFDMQAGASPADHLRSQAQC